MVKWKCGTWETQVLLSEVASCATSKKVPLWDPWWKGACCEFFQLTYHRLLLQHIGMMIME